MAIYLSDENGKLKKYSGTSLPLGLTAIVNELNKTEKVETIYDTSDSEKMLGKPGGLLGGESFTGLDLSKYKYLRIYSYQLGLFLTTIAHISHDTSVNFICSGAGLSVDQKVIMTCQVTIDNSKTTLTNTHIGYYNTSGYVNRNANASYFIYKIEGVY